MSKALPLTVKGAKYNQRNGDEQKEKLPERIASPNANVNGHYATFFQAQQNASLKPAPINPPPNTTGIATNKPPAPQPTKPVPQSSETKVQYSDKYWKLNEDDSRGEGDVVIIHVCDENQQISKDFCCKRDILVKHMKYFEKFLAENENGYDDIDISVHCDVEIFEWLMTYIHEPDSPPKIEKAIIVSILISSEFLQMDSLVELCIQHVASNLSEIIKLPIDLSCISEKLVNRIALLTQPKTLSETKDRKDKILTKLYKRRVELDFSRKGSTARATSSGSFSGLAAPPVASTRTIAASLTCCRHCGLVYLDNYVSFLSCRSSPPTIDFRGQLASRHSAITGWSLTSYLKTLHSGGMGWDAIYWHVWAACVVFRVENVMISTLEVDRYTVEPDGLFIRASVLKDDAAVDGGANDLRSSSISPTSTSGSAGLALPPRAPALFSLSLEDDCRMGPLETKSFKLHVTKRTDLFPANPTITSSLNPARPPDVLTSEIFDLICTQMKYIVGLSHKVLIQKTMKSVVESARLALPPRAVDFGEVLWRNPPRTSTYEGSVTTVELAAAAVSAENERRRGRSPGRGARASSLESRKHSQSLPKGGRMTVLAAKQPVTVTTSELSNASNDSDQENSGRPPAGGERRSRSVSTGARPTTALTGGISGGSAKNLRKLIPTADDASIDEEEAPLTASINGVPLDPLAAKQIAVLQSLPPEVQVRIMQTKGPVHGLWMVEHPLQIRSTANEDMIRTVTESSIIAAKKLEWELDIMREFDEKRMEQFERFLVSRRARAADAPNENKKQQRGGRNKNIVDYYKDKGRQASNR